jgi:hypothetical protein
MKPVLVVMAMGIVASTIVELLEGWRRYQMRKSQRAASR